MVLLTLISGGNSDALSNMCCRSLIKIYMSIDTVPTQDRKGLKVSRKKNRFSSVSNIGRALSRYLYLGNVVFKGQINFHLLSYRRLFNYLGTPGPLGSQEMYELTYTSTLST